MTDRIADAIIGQVAVAIYEDIRLRNTYLPPWLEAHNEHRMDAVAAAQAAVAAHHHALELCGFIVVPHFGSINTVPPRYIGTPPVTDGPSAA